MSSRAIAGPAAALFVILARPAGAEQAFVHGAGSVGEGRTSVGLDVATSWGRGGDEVSPTLRLSHGLSHRVEFGVRAGAVGDTVDGFRPSTGLQVPVLFELNLGALREEGLRWEVGLALLAGLRSFGGEIGNSLPETGFEIGASVRLSDHALLFGRGSYQATWLGPSQICSGYDFQVGYRPCEPGEPQFRHFPSLSLGIELALASFRPFVAVRGGLRIDPREEPDPRLEAVAGTACVF